MTSGSDEIEKDVNSIISEAGITLDTRLLRKDIIILPLEVADNLGETSSGC